FAGGTVTVQLTANADPADVLAIRNQGTGSGQIGVSGSNVTFSGGNIRTFAGGTNGAGLGGTPTDQATSTGAPAVLKTHTVTSTSGATLARTVSGSLTDGDGGTSNAPTKTIGVS